MSNSILDALGGAGGMAQIAQQLGIDQQTAATGTAALLPAILGGFKKQAQGQAGGIEGLAGMLALNGQATVRSAVGHYPCRVSVKLMEQTAPWAPNPASQALLNIWQQTGQALGQRIVPEARGGLSDGNWVWHHVPTIDGLGPLGANSHCSEQSDDGLKEQEYVLASSFVPKTVLNTLAILQLIERNNNT